LVLFHGKQILPAAYADLFADVPLRLQRIPHHHVPGQRYLRQRRLGRRQFGPLLSRAYLREDRLGAQGVDRDQMGSRNLLAVNASQRLAIHRERFVFGDPRPRKPLSQRPLEGGDIEPFEDTVQRRHTGAAAGQKAQIDE